MNEDQEEVILGISPEPTWYVCYTVLGQNVAAGPYTRDDVMGHRLDIASYEGVSNVFITEYIPGTYKMMEGGALD